MAPTIWSAIAAGAMALAVATGAFGAHALKARVPPELLQTWETAVRYHAWHALGLFAVDWIGAQVGHSTAWRTAAWLMVIGIVLFSGSLYGLVLTRARWLGPITPLGGTAWIVAWIALAIAVARR